MNSSWSQEDIYLVSQRAWELLMQGRYSESSILLEGLRTVAPTNPWPGRALALVHLRTGRPDAALHALGDHRDMASRRIRFEALLALGRAADAAGELAAMRPNLDPPALQRCNLLVEATRRQALR